MDDDQEVLRTRIDELEKENQFLLRRITAERDASLSEFKNRLASQLRLDYINMIDAEKVPMSEGLGENLRLQMRQMFNYLNHVGIDCSR